MSWLFSALVIDDDTAARNILEKFLETDGRVQVFEGLDSAINAIETIENLSPDVIFLDINMPYEDGLKFAARLKTTGNNSILVFCTAFKNYALDAFELRPFDFLIKPFGINELSPVINKIIAEIGLRNDRSNKLWSIQDIGKIKFKTSTGFIFIKPSDILFIRTIDNSCFLHTKSGLPVRIMNNLSDIDKYIGGKQFVKINRSAIVNIDYINYVDRKKKSCLLKDGNVQHEFIILTKSIDDLEGILQLKLG